MRRGGALPGLLWRPAALAWIPLSACVALAVAMFGTFVWWQILGNSIQRPVSARTLVWVFPALIGLLVGQATKELQHCHFSWALPALRRRLLRGAVVVGLVVAVSTREILTALMAPLMFALGSDPARQLQEVWLALPSVSVGAVAVAFMAFWIGVRPSAVSWLGVMAPLIVFSAPLTDVVAYRPILALAVTTPLTAFLIHQAFGVSSARRRPFIFTKPLVGGGKRIDQPQAWTTGKAWGAVWRIEQLGDDVANWVRAGVYENHGFRNPVVRVAGVLIPAMVATFMIVHLVVPLLFDGAAASIWNPRGTASVGLRRFLRLSSPLFGFSPIVAIPISVVLAAYASISLTRRASYPLSRRQMARVEFWGSLVENLVICGLLTALLIGFWSFAYGLGVTGSRTLLARLGYSSWVPFLLGPMGVVFLLMPITQLFRLHHLRAPIGWSSVRQLIEIMGLMFVLTVLGTLVSTRTFGSAPMLSLLVDGPLFVVAAVLAQVAYRRLVDRYFATADLV